MSFAKTALKSLAVAVVAVPAAIAASGSANAAAGIRTGTLSCDIGASKSVIVRSKAPLDCTYKAFGGARQAYNGTLTITGLSVGITRSGHLTWAVFAPAYREGQLSGTYRGATAGITLAAGGSVNALVGGADGSITLQPLSVSRSLGFGTSVGYASLTLDAAAPAMEPRSMQHRRPMHHRPMHHRGM